MKHFRLIFLSVIFWQLTFAPQVLASNEITNKEFSKIITQLNEKHYNGKELVQFIKDTDQKLYQNVERYLKANGSTQYEKIQIPQVEMIKDKEFKLTVDQKVFTVMMLKDKSFKITYNNKSTVLSFNNGNIEEWINSLDSLKVSSNSFHLSNLFIDTAQAASIIAVVITVLVLVGLLAYFSFSSADTGTLNAKAEEALNLCKSGLDFDDPKIVATTKVLEAKYRDKCTKNSKSCDKIKEALDCLNGLSNPTSATDGSRDAKPVELDPTPTPVDMGSTARPR